LLDVDDDARIVVGQRADEADGDGLPFDVVQKAMMIREARSEDISSLRDIESAAGRLFAQIGMTAVAEDEPLSEDSLRGYQSGGRAWVAVDDSDRPVAYLVVDNLDGNAHIEQVSVRPENMRQGLGRVLIEHLADWATEQGMPAMTLTTFADVPWNGPYYERLGFEPLSDAELTPGLQDRRDHERARGLDKWPRICMRRALLG
jgi:GNAT superfamily N-acetyltransferase